MKPMTSPTLLVLAAGMGSRYGSLKQMDPVGPYGEAIVDYSIYDALRAGFDKVVFVIRKDIEQPFKMTVGVRFERHVDVKYVFQELDKLPPGFSVPTGRTKPWGTSHAVLVAADAINEPFAVINADDFYGAESYRSLARYLQSDLLNYAMVGFVLRNTLSDFGPVSRGVCRVDGNDFLQGIVELTNIVRDGVHAKNTDATGLVTKLSGDEVVSMNMWGFTSRIFGQLTEHFQRFLESSGPDSGSESYLPDAVNELVLSRQARVTILHTGDSWCGITYREDHARAVERISHLIRDGSYPERLWS
jgi:UTP-glucose-1-phosphate uridylyltransferase